jgi:hypothetical protein
MGQQALTALRGTSERLPASLTGVTGFAIAGIFLSGALRKPRRGAIIIAVVVFALGMVAVGGGAGGGGSGSTLQTDPGTPVGNYNITVTATSGSTTHTTSFVLVVQ